MQKRAHLAPPDMHYGRKDEFWPIAPRGDALGYSTEPRNSNLRLSVEMWFGNAYLRNAAPQKWFPELWEVVACARVNALKKECLTDLANVRSGGSLHKI